MFCFLHSSKIVFHIYWRSSHANCNYVVFPLNKSIPVPYVGYSGTQWKENLREIISFQLIDGWLRAASSLWKQEEVLKQTKSAKSDTKLTLTIDWGRQLQEENQSWMAIAQSTLPRKTIVNKKVMTWWFESMTSFCLKSIFSFLYCHKRVYSNAFFSKSCSKHRVLSEKCNLILIQREVCFPGWDAEKFIAFYLNLA